MKITVQFVSFSIAGIGKLNEDSWGCRALEDGSFVAVVADGVGGNYGGSIASALAVESALDSLSSNPALPLETALEIASEALKKRGATDLISGQMATTLSLCIVQKSGRVDVVHVGDSRIYHLRRQGILQKTKDQTEVAALVAAGILSNEQAKTYPRRTVLRSALSAKGNYETFRTEFQLEKNDRIVLLTDGAYRLVSKMTLRDLSIQCATIEELLAALTIEIKDANDDDATAIIIEAT